MSGQQARSALSPVQMQAVLQRINDMTLPDLTQEKIAESRRRIMRRANAGRIVKDSYGREYVIQEDGSHRRVDGKRRNRRRP